LRTSLKLIEEGNQRRQQLNQLISALKNNLRLGRWKLAESDTPIQPLIVGEHLETTQLRNALLDRGLLVPAIRPPTVPKGRARLRISLSADHTVTYVERLVIALHALHDTVY
jgi:8-amino-7-oxononanoate synthase